MNIDGTIQNIGQGNTISNNGIINSNSTLNGFIVNNNSAGTITYGKSPATFTITAATAFAGDVYTDANLNVYTVINSITNGTTLLTAVDPIASIVASGTLTKVSGNVASPASITYSAVTTLANAVTGQVTTNLGALNTGAISLLSNIAPVSLASIGVIDPGGPAGKGIANFASGSQLAISSTLKLQIAAGATAGVHFDRVTNSSTNGGFDLTAAKLDVTGIYTPAGATTIDIITTNATGTLSGTFATVTGLSSGWTLNYISGTAGKVQLVYSAPTGIISAQSGNWSASSTWVGGVPPDATTSSVIISPGHTVTADTAITRDSGTTTTVDSGGSLVTNFTYTSNGTTTINGIFQINQGGFGAGSGTWTYGTASTLIYNHTSGTYGPIDGSHTYWPATNGPANVTIVNSLGAVAPNGINLGVARTVSGIVQTAGGITNANNLTINGSLQLNAGGFASGSPTYGPTSTLIYNSATYGRGDEWTTALSGAGYPTNVRVGNGVNTTLNVVNGSAVYRRAAGNLVVSTGSTLSISGLTTGNSTVGLEFLGNINNDGTITLDGGTNGRLKAVNLNNGVAITNGSSAAIVNLSSTIGGDLELTGNYNDNATFNSNQRAVFFTGAGAIQTIGGNAPGTLNIDYIVVTRTAPGVVQLLKSTLIGAPAGGTGLTLSSATNDILDLNTRTLTLGTAATACGFLGNGLIKSTASSPLPGSLVINGTGALGTLTFEAANNTLANLTINRTAGTGTAGVTLGSALNVTTTLSVAATSTLTLGGNLSVSSAVATSAAGIIAGTGALVKTGAGVLTLSAVSGNNTANTYSVGTTISAASSGTINVTGLANITSTAITQATQSVTFSSAAPANGTYQLLPGALTVGTQSFSHNANATKAVSFDYLSSTVTVAFGPAIILGGTTTTAFTTTYGAASTAQSFTISGGNLTADLIATAPTGFEVSSDGTNYGSTATFTQTAGAASGSLRIRLAATAPVLGSYNSNNIVLSSTGVTSVNIVTPASGNAVTARVLTITANNQSKQFGNTLYTGSGITVFTTSGLRNSETVGSITISSTGAAPEAIVGSYTIEPSAATGGTFVSSNYTITYATTGTLTVTAPATTDYRTVNSGDWTDLTIWEKWSGTAWTQPTTLEGYPCQNAPARIYILNSHNVTCGIGVTGTNRPTRIEINAGVNNASLTFTTTNYFEFNNADIVLTSTGAGNALLDVGNANIYSFGTLNISKSTGGGINKVIINNGLLNLGTNITMGGLAAETFIEFTGSGILTSSGGTISGGTIIAGIGTVRYNKGGVAPAGDQTVGAYSYNNLILANTSIKTLAAGVIVTRSLTISDTAIAGLPNGSNYTIPSLIYAGVGQTGAPTTYGSNNVGTVADVKTDTYFNAATTGTITVSSNLPYVNPNVPRTYTYTGLPQGAVPTNSGTGSNYTYLYTNNGGSAYSSSIAPTDIGNYFVEVSVAADGVWLANSAAVVGYSIVARTLTITANSFTKQLGSTVLTGLGSNLFTSSGLQNGQTIGSITFNSTGASAGAVSGTYDTVPTAATGGTFVASNYTIIYTNGTLTVATPTTGNYRSKGSGSWTALSTWERWDGAAWVEPQSTSPEGYPTQFASQSRIDILDGHAVTCSIGITGANRPTRLEIAAGSSNTSLTFTSSNYFEINGNLVLTAAGTGSAFVNVNAAYLGVTDSVSLADTPSSATDCEVVITTGAMYVFNSNNITMSGAADENAIRLGSGLLTCTGNITGGTIVGGTGTVNYSGAAQTVGAYNFYNLILSGTLTKTLNASTFVTESLTISGSAIASLAAGTTYNINSLIYGTVGQAQGTYGSTTSAATNQDDTKFASTGMLNVVLNTPDISVTVGTYTYTGLRQGPNSASNTGSSSNYTFSYRSNGGAVYAVSANAPINAGNYFVTVTLAADGSNASRRLVDTPFSITTAPLTITANNDTKVVSTTYVTGAGSTAFTSTGLQNSETIGSVTIASTGAVSTAALGTYPIVASAATGGTFSASNYTITYSNGTLTVVQDTGDYRSKANGDWIALTTWERWDGTTWAEPTIAQGYPCQNAAPARVDILNGHAVTCGIGVTTNRLTRLEIAAGANDTSLTFTASTYFETLGNIVVTTTGAGTALLNVGNSRLVATGSSLVRLNNLASPAPGTAKVLINNGTLVSNGNNLQMIGDAAKTIIEFTGAGLLQTAGATANAISGGTIIPGAGTVEFLGAAQTVGAYNFNNLTLSGSGTKTINALANITGNVRIAGTAIASLDAATTYNVDTLTLDCGGTVNGTWGSTTSSATNTNNIYFAATTGILNVATNSTVNPLAVVTEIQPTCTTATGTITVTVQNVTDTYSFNNGSSYQTSNVLSGAAVGTYNVIIKHRSGCTSPTTVVVLSSALKEWVGGTDTSWNNPANWNPPGVPVATNCITAPDGSNDLIIDGTNYTASLYSLTVENGVTVTVTSTNSLKVTDFINVNSGGTLTVQNNANLVQVNDAAVNTGNILYNRATPPLLETDYTYWSSPVVGQTLTAISPVNYPDPGGYFYSFNNLTDQWSSALSGSTVMLPGVGYIMRGQNIPGPNIAATFTGVPNNGTQTVQSLSSTNSFLIGNPYPSAIDADLFLAANSNIEGTIYFWTHRTPIADLVYSADDYASYNTTGGVQATSGGAVPTGKIAATQGFFATSAAVGPVSFNNSMRVDGSGVPFNNSNFYKTANNQKPNSFEKHRVWLDLTNSKGAFKQMLVGYITNATNEYDSRFDGKSFDGNEFVDFYSINENKNLTIQGRAVPFDENDAVPLGFRSKISGEFSINIHKVDGLLTNQDIVIEDKLTNTFVNLKNGSFTFSTVAGIFNDRFVLRFKDKTLGTTDLSGHTSKILISVKDKQIKINSFSENIDKVAIYDLLGRQIYQKTKVSGNELILSNFASSNQTLLVKTTLENGITVTDKVIY
jgi:hypothetical protein